tara:strand:+ start:188 stop:532 length:345 start_codon:yes stop_codon:yes gene_type:complete
MTKSPVKVVEERFDSIEKLVNEKCEEVVSRLSAKIEGAFEHILSSVVKNTEGNLGRALSDNAKKTKSKGGKCSGCKKEFKFLGSVKKHHLVDPVSKVFNGICPTTKKAAKTLSS